MKHFVLESFNIRFERSELVGTVFLNPSKAFDLVNHDTSDLINIVLEHVQWTGLDLT